MYQAIIVDDEKWVVKSLTATLDAMQVMEQFHIVAELYDGLSAIRYIKEQQPDLAFVDVRPVSYTHLTLPTKRIV